MGRKKVLSEGKFRQDLRAPGREGKEAVGSQERVRLNMKPNSSILSPVSPGGHPLASESRKTW